jgi:hypothetical protein
MIKKFTFPELFKRSNRQVLFNKFRMKRKNEHLFNPISKGELKGVSKVMSSFFLFTHGQTQQTIGLGEMS